MSLPTAPVSHSETQLLEALKSYQPITALPQIFIEPLEEGNFGRAEFDGAHGTVSG